MRKEIWIVISTLVSSLFQYPAPFAARVATALAIAGFLIAFIDLVVAVLALAHGQPAKLKRSTIVIAIAAMLLYLLSQAIS